MDPKRLLQQCRIYQHKNREIIFIPYAHAYNFYLSLDELVINGRRIKITFPYEKVGYDSFLVERIISCDNGYEFLKQLLEPLSESLELIEKASRQKMRNKLNTYKRDKSLYFDYLVSYIYDQDYEQHFIFLEPKGEGLKSQSFEIDIGELG